MNPTSSLPKPATASLLARIKREAKKAVCEDLTHSQALEAGAQAAGWPSWHSLQQAAASGGTPAPEAFELLVDPVLPDDFDDTPNDQRTKAQLDAFWDRPFARSEPDGRYEVRCLDNGAWDRSTHYGMAATLDEARELAQTKLAKWRSMRSRPTAMLETEGGKWEWHVVLMPQRPDQEAQTLHVATSQEDAARFINEWPRTPE